MRTFSLWAGGLPVALVLLLSGCAGYRQALYQVEQSLQQTSPGNALTVLEAADFNDRDRAVYLLDKALLQRYAGDYQASVQTFEQAKRVLGTLEATSVTETGAALTWSENLTSYEGRLYERLLLHVYQALNYLALEQLDAARVEALQVDLLLRRLYPGTQAAPNHSDALARYLSGLIFQAVHEPDDALIAYRHALAAYTQSGADYGVSVPRDLQERLIRLAEQLGLQNDAADFRRRFGIDPKPVTARSGEVVVLVSAGLAPRVYEQSSMSQDLVSGRMYRISLPALQDRPSRVRSLRVTAGSVSVGGEVVEDISRAAHRALADELPGMTARALSRMVAKDVAARKASEEDALAGALINFLGVVAEQADTRSWNILPDTIRLATLRLPAGEHAVTVQLYDAWNNVLTTRQFAPVVVKPGGITFLTLYWPH